MKVPDGNRFLSFILTKIQSHSLSCAKHLINEDMKGEKEQSLLLHWAGLGCPCAGLQSELLPVSDRSPSTLPCPAPATPAPPARRGQTAQALEAGTCFAPLLSGSLVSGKAFNHSRRRFPGV